MTVNEPANLKVAIRKIGAEQHDAIIVDHFFRDAEAVRAEALKLPYAAPPYPYPGVISKPAWDYRQIVQVVSHLVGREIRPEQVTFRFSMVTMTGAELQPCQRIPHVDPVAVAGLIYLTPPEQCQGGTAFYRHRKTGVEQLPGRPGAAYRETMARFGHTRLDTWAEELFTPSQTPDGFISETNQDWELTSLVEMQFNRLLIYNGKVFHSGYIQDGQFGEGLEERRLTLNFFIERF